MNKFGIPESVLAEIRVRDDVCAYCRKQMLFPYDKTNVADSATIEHLNREGPFHWKDGLEARDIVICCSACNSSRGQKLLTEWFESRYCLERGINADSVSETVRAYLDRTC